MKALTICQPYAALILTGEKLVENRTWPTRHRGPLAIHAGRSRDWLNSEPWPAGRPPLVFGAVLGVVELVACLEIEEILQGTCPPEFRDLAGHRHASGPWCWVVRNPRPLAKPVPWSGKLALWELPDSVVAGL